MKRWTRWGLGAAALAAVLLSAYLWWWKPLLLASLRYGLEQALVNVSPPVTFREVGLRRVSTLVVRGVAVGRTGDDNSLEVPEARLAFDLGALIRGRFNFVAALRRITLLRPQAILAWPDLVMPSGEPQSRAFPLPPGVVLHVSNGRVLLRSRGPGAGVLALRDIDAELAGSPATGLRFSSRLTAPSSPRRSLSVAGTVAPGRLSFTVKATRLRVAPLRPWLEPLGLPVRLDAGELGSALAIDLESEPAPARASNGRAGGRTRWRLARAEGRLDTDGVSVTAPGLPMPVENLTGRARATGRKVALERVMFTTSGTGWILSGSVEDFARPVVHLEAGAPSFQLSLLLPEAEGAGPVKLRAEGPAASPVISAVFDLAGARAAGLTATRFTGAATIEEWGRRVQFDQVRARTPAGLVTCSGAWSAANASADATFALIPADPLFPACAGTATLREGEARFEARTGDGLWKLRGRGRRRAGALSFSADGTSTGGARIALRGSLGTAEAKRLDAQIDVSGASFAALYLERRHDIFRRLPLTLNASASVRGTAAEPVFTANLAGSRLSLGGTSLPVSGTLKLSRRALELVPVRAGETATATLLLPFEPGKKAAARIRGEGFPLRLVWTLVPDPGKLSQFSGGFVGTLDIDDLTGHPTVDGRGQVRDLLWEKTRLGTLAFTVEARDRTMTMSSLALRGPIASADGDGTLTLGERGWQGAGRLNIGYLKSGRTALDGHAEVSASSGDRGLAATVKVTALRLNATAWPDAEVEIAVPEEGALTVKASWEETLSAVWESREGRSVSLSCSYTDLPIEPLLGALDRAAPADRISGSLSLKGSVERATLKADLRWARGEATLRGWTSAPVPGTGSITANASDRAVAQWVPFLRGFGPLKDLPDLDGLLSTRGFAVEWGPGKLGLNGWITIRDAAIRGRAVGNGTLRVKRTGAETELEGNISGDAGEFTLFPTRITETPEGRDTAGAFGWGKVEVGKTVSSCARGTLTLHRRGARGSGSLVLTGLALGDLTAPDLAFRFEGEGGAWTLTSPPDSPWQAIGTVSASGARLAVLPDDRVGGRWVVLRGPDGAQVKVTGVWPLPNAPEKLGFECHRLPASPILVAVGAPPQEGLAEADLDWTAASDPPLSGRMALSQGRWGDFAYDLFELRGTGTPGHDFVFSSIRVERAGDLKAKGTGTLALVPERAIRLELTVEKLALRYLKPFGFVEDADSNGAGRLVVSGDFGNPEVSGSLVCSPGTYVPPTGFAELHLADGRLVFDGRRATLNATLNDAGGAAVIVAGSATFTKLVPDSYTVSMTAPTWIRVDGLPRLYKGLAKGRINLDGTPAEPVLKGEVILQQGRLQTPPKADHPDPKAFAERVDWDLKVRVGEGVSYAVEPVAGAALDVANLSPKSYLHIKGRGAGFEVFGNVLADSGPVTLIMGKQLFRKEAP